MSATITVRNVADTTQRKLKHRAVDNGRSLEAEIRAILDAMANEPDHTALVSPLFEAAAAFRASIADIGFTMPPRVHELPREVFG